MILAYTGRAGPAWNKEETAAYIHNAFGNSID